MGELKPNKIEVAFFPYKASMWDSLESVWLAVKDDTQCETYVVPIPYYDRLPDFTLGAFHDESSQYPSYVPITNWREYDVEKRHPDVIIIHNPYDESNVATSVHPDFYAKRLKDFTDLLVYIPYFVSSGDVDENNCVYPGILYADKIFLQSESIRETYIRVFSDLENEYNCKGEFGDPESKFIALGSPKLDKVINSKPEDFVLPEEWRKLMEKPDGALKKVVLYNTTIDGLLRWNDQCLKKIQSVLDIFRSRDDVVLWWRPHPLNEAACQSMLPELLAEYNQIVHKYQNDGFGIYDDTGDLHRALVLTDCYFGDFSSLIALYRCTGKRILLQQYKRFFNNKMIKPILGFDNIENNIIWISLYNALYRFDLKTLDNKFVGRFPGKTSTSNFRYMYAARIGDDIFFAPFLADAIAVYNTNTGNFRTIMFPKPVWNDKDALNKVYKFLRSIAFGSYIYFIPHDFPAIVRYDTINDTFEQFTNWISQINKSEVGRYFSTAKAIGSEIFALSDNSNTILVFNMETCNSQIYKAGEDKQIFIDLCFDGEYIWLSPKNSNEIVRWDKVNGKHEIVKFSDGDIPFTAVEYLAGYIWLLPIWGGNAAFRINARSLQVENADVFSEIMGLPCNANIKNTENTIDNSHYLYCKAIDDRLIAYFYKSSEIISYVPGDKKAQKRCINNSAEPYTVFNGEYQSLREIAYYNLNHFLDELSSSESDDNEITRRAKAVKKDKLNSGTAGKHIYSCIKKNILIVA